MSNEKIVDAKEAKSPKEALKPSAIKQTDMPTNNVPKVKLNFGEILIAPIQKDGSEGNLFKVNIRTYKQYFSDETKFVIKKKYH